MRQSSWKSGLPFSIRVIEVRDESRSARTLMFRRPESDPDVAASGDAPDFNLSGFVPGQFVMVWIPRLDEKPFTISYLDDRTFGITVLKRGPFTKALHAMNPGDWVGFRGPYGRGFSLSAGGVVVGGGVGMATMATLIDRLDKPKILQGARTADELLFLDRFPGMDISTDDGSKGRRGFVTDALAELISADRPAMVYACGPEPMMARVLQMCRDRCVPCQASLERFMKCGFGVCGQCCCDGRRVCRDGPVFNSDELAGLASFGRFARLKSGSKVGIGAYHGGGKGE